MGPRASDPRGPESRGSQDERCRLVSAQRGHGIQGQHALAVRRRALAEPPDRMRRHHEGRGARARGFGWGFLLWRSHRSSPCDMWEAGAHQRARFFRFPGPGPTLLRCRSTHSRRQEAARPGQPKRRARFRAPNVQTQALSPAPEVRAVNDVIADIIRQKAGRDPSVVPTPWSEGHGPPERGRGVQHYISEGKR